jgi:hypothetical protein
MESDRFDNISRYLGAARSRRHALAALATALVAHLFRLSAPDEAEAKCKGYKGKCKSKSKCCDGVGLHCKKDRCRCKKGWKRCASSGKGCTHVKADPDNCGSCGNECPPATPCCINGSCQEMCGGSCCVDCYNDVFQGLPQPGTETCCSSGSGALCKGNKKDSSDDVCCWPDQECVAGECCSDGYDGAVICGGVCCASASCCNGECCPEGQVCAMTTEGLACVTANRTCDNDGECLADETCVEGTCCKDDRTCHDIVDGDFCCPAGEYCDSQGPTGSCCAINTRCNSTWRGHRVRK